MTVGNIVLLLGFHGAGKMGQCQGVWEVHVYLLYCSSTKPCNISITLYSASFRQFIKHQIHMDY